jgi:hypothetical protein
MKIEIEAIQEAVSVAKSLADFFEKRLESSGFRVPVPNEQCYYTEQRELVSSLRRMTKTEGV